MGSTILSVVGMILLAGVVSVVVYYIRRAVLNVARVEDLTATTELQGEQIRVQEAADRDARVKARKEFDAKAGSVRTADDAAELLGEAFDNDADFN